VVHAYTFDSAGRLSADTVDLSNVESGQNVDSTILRIGRTYDDLGRLEMVTSYSDTSGATAVNQVKYRYNGWGKLAQEWQSHTGVVDTQSTPSVQYVYTDGASGGVAKYMRLSQVVYPNGCQAQYGYGTPGAIDDIMSRWQSISDDAGDLAQYAYLGRGTVVKESHPSVSGGLNLDHDPNEDHSFSGFDRFGRVVDQLWADDADTPIDQYKYGYDRAGNRVWKQNAAAVGKALDELYAYDQLGRLTNTQRGTLDFTDPDDPTIAPSSYQDWTLDGLGNFSEFDDDGASQTRAANGANEITGITGGWISPSYDRAGNMISGPKPGDETARVHDVYDAWNHLVSVYQDDGDGVFEPGTDDAAVASYQYDGLNRRIEKVVTGTSDAHYFYNHDWQMLEERFVDGEGDTVASNQYVWSARYIDASIVRFHDGNGDGDYVDPEDNIRYYTDDANYNVTATIDATTRDVMERYVYTAYGTANVYSPTWTDPTAATTDGPLYCGYFFDADTGNYFVRARYYSVALATWISRDPIAYQGMDQNLYRYVQNAPVMHTDPSGLVVFLYDIPVAPWKCAIVTLALTAGQGLVGWDVFLLGHWMKGSGKALQLKDSDFGVFDADGSERWKVMEILYANARGLSNNIKCGESATRAYRQPKIGAFSHTKMISNYDFSADCAYGAKRECDEKGCCKAIILVASCTYHASDIVDFWADPPNVQTGQNMFGIGPIQIADRLVRACFPKGRGFELTANCTRTMSWRLPCK
jgi:RHS repeat-associated protein